MFPVPMIAVVIEFLLPFCSLEKRCDAHREHEQTRATAQHAPA
jgi:hypothetical protein